MSSADRQSPIGTRALLLAAIGVIGVVLIVLGLVGSDGEEKEDADTDDRGNSSTQQGSADAEDPGIAQREADDPIAMGDPDAPVAVVEYADFRCPFCARFTRETLPEIKKKYIDTGLVRYEYRDFAIFGDQSLNAALAGRAAGRQDRFWEFLDAVHEAAPDDGHPDISRADLIDFAEQAGVPDLKQFEQDLDDPDIATAVQADADEARSLGINSVPFFAIDNVALSGAQPLAAFEQIIEERLAAHGAGPTE